MKKDKRTNHSISWGKAAALCALTAVTSFTAAFHGFQRYCDVMMPGYQANDRVYKKLGEIRETVDKNYVGKYKLQNAVDGAAAGFIAGVGDRWSSYMSAEEIRAYSMSFAGKATGVGVSVLYFTGEDYIHIYDVAADSSADRAGITTKQVIVGAEGLTVAKDGYEAVIDAILGEAGTDVTLQLRDLNGTVKSVTMERCIYEQTLVTGRMLKDGKTGLVRIYNFRQTADEQMGQVLEDLQKQGAKQLIFDVRNDPGGSIESLCNMLDVLLPEGKIMTMRSSDGEEQVYESDEEAIDLPIAVIINYESVSAAEFFAAVLQEYDRAVIVGEQTLGKGYSQRTYKLSDGSALRLSDREYFTPKMKSLIGVGVIPDVQTPMDEDKRQALYLLEEEQDDQLQAALRELDHFE